MLICLSLLLVFVNSSHGQIFANVPPDRGPAGVPGGAFMFGGHDRVKPGPPMGRHPPQNILGGVRDQQEEPEQLQDPRHPPKTGRLRLGPILFDPEHLVYDDNDDYSEDDHEESARPRVGLELFSFLSPFSNFFVVLWKLFCSFLLKLEKQVNRMIGRQTEDGQMSILTVLSIIWFIFGSVAVIVNQVMNRLLRDADESEVDNSSSTNFLRLPSLMPKVEMTPPTPTATSDVDNTEGAEPAKRRRTESPRKFRRKRSSTPQSSPEKSISSSNSSSPKYIESRIFRRRERDRVAKEQCDCSVLGSFQHRICDKDMTTAEIQLVDETLHFICRDKFSRQKFQNYWKDAANIRMKENIAKSFSHNFPGMPEVEITSLRDLTFLDLKTVQMGHSDEKTLSLTFDVSICFTLEILLAPPLSEEKLRSNIVIDFLQTKFEINVQHSEPELTRINETSLTFIQTGFADVKLHWNQNEPSNEALKDLAEEVVLDAVRNVVLNLAFKDLLFQENEFPSLTAKTEQLEVTILKASNLKLFRNFNNNNTSSNASDVTTPCRPYATVEVDTPHQTFSTDIGDAHFQAETSEVFWKNSKFSISVSRDTTQELLIEIWNQDTDESKPTFLGLCIFSVPDLISSTPTQTRTVSLRRSPFDHPENEEQYNQSSVTVQFRLKFDESGSDSGVVGLSQNLRGVHKISEIRRSAGVGGQAVKTSTTTYVIDRGSFSPFKGSKNNSPAPSGDEPHIHSVNAVALAALNDLHLRRQAGNSATAVQRTTLFIRSVQKFAEMDLSAEATNEITTTPQHDTSSSDSLQSSRSLADVPKCEADLTKRKLETFRKTDNPETSPKNLEKQKKGILSSLKRKFYKSPKFSKKAMKQPDVEKTPVIIEEVGSDDTSSSCSDCSSERSFELSEWRGHLSLSWQSLNSNSGSPAPFLAPTTTTSAFKGDDVSSLSDVSGVSVTSMSFKSGALEEVSSNNSDSMTRGVTASLAPSTGGGSPAALIVETVEHGLKHYYLIPEQVGKKSHKHLRKHGRKLHLFMDHIFVARHVKGSPSCPVCHKRIVSRIGKQGYVCRCCHLVCHKSCHHKVEKICSDSNLNSMEL